jgi:hypothetical protein
MRDFSTVVTPSTCVMGWKTQITAVETEHGAKFGLFTSLPADISGKWKPYPKAWVFSLTQQTVHS